MERRTWAPGSSNWFLISSVTHPFHAACVHPADSFNFLQPVHSISTHPLLVGAPSDQYTDSKVLLVLSLSLGLDNSNFTSKLCNWQSIHVAYFNFISGAPPLLLPSLTIHSPPLPLPGGCVELWRGYSDWSIHYLILPIELLLPQPRLNGSLLHLSCTAACCAL